MNPNEEQRSPEESGLDEILSELTPEPAETETPEPQQEPAAESESAAESSPADSAEQPEEHQPEPVNTVERNTSDSSPAPESAERDELLHALNDFGIHAATYTDAADMLRAQSAGLTLEEYRNRRRQEQESQRAALEQNPEYQRMRERVQELEQRERNRQFETDLAEVKKAYPELKAKDVSELGREFSVARYLGLDPVSAYELTLAKEKRGKKPEPPVVGKLNASGKAGDYYTSEEIDRMTDAEIDLHMDDILKSMNKRRK